MNPNNVGDGAVICAILCPSARIGLFIRQPDKNDPKWKIPAGEIMPGESVESALIRELEEETGFAIPHQRVRDELILGNDGCKVFSLGSETVRGRSGMHEKHGFVVLVEDPTEIIALDAQIRKEDDMETIETKVFSFDKILTAPDFLPPQRGFLNKVIGYATCDKVV